MVEMILLAAAASIESVSDALLDEHQALSVSVEDADAGTDAERALFGEPGMPAVAAAWEHSRVRALFADEEQAARAATALLAQGDDRLRLASIEPLENQDWVRLTQSQFAPTAITPEFWIVPTWHEPPPEARRVIRLDPGMAFGTGTHPTTRMCLRWIARRSSAGNAPWSRVLDYGCGSGILAIGAALHGARSIDAVDIDPEAVKASIANARANDVTLACGLPDLAAGTYGLVLANILATPLKVLAPLLCTFLESGADLVLAGILERQAEEIAATYQPWLVLEPADLEDGWVLMAGRSTRRMA